uniref:Uncharacterized protein n=1 Tax=Anopheles darlingi TaxID=43151 RepID=A0A2M4DEM3_ANODA
MQLHARPPESLSGVGLAAAAAAAARFHFVIWSTHTHARRMHSVYLNRQQPVRTVAFSFFAYSALSLLGPGLGTRVDTTFHAGRAS